MTIEAEVLTALRHLAGGQIFPDVAPEGTLPPYITFQGVGGEPVNFLTGDKPSKTNTRMQVNVWAANRLEASALGAQVEDALRGATHLQPEVLTGRVATSEEKYRGTMQDFSLWL